jgi:hypothetical protein
MAARPSPSRGLSTPAPAAACPLRQAPSSRRHPIEPDKDDTATEKHPFHEKQDGVRPLLEAPSKDDAAAEQHRPFHEKQDGVRPSSEAPSKDDAATKKHRVVDPSLQTAPTVQSLCQA